MPEALARTGICEETIRCGLTDEAAASNQTQEVNIVYRKVDTNLNFVDREKEVEKFWKDNKIFEKSMGKRLCYRQLIMELRIMIIWSNMLDSRLQH